MKKVLQHAITAVLAAVITYFVVSKIDANRRNRELALFDAEIAKLEAQLNDLRKAPTVPNAASAPVLTSSSAPAVAMTRYDASTTGSKCRMDGTSSIHDWKMETAIIGGYFEIDSKVNLDPAQATLSGAAPEARIAAAAFANMPVRSFKSYNTRMDEVYQDHMEAIKYRRIDYSLKELVVAKTPHTPNTPFEFESKGDLIVHGVTNTISMPVKITRVDAKQLKITGTTKLKMTDFKVQPPSPNIAGVQIKTGDEITITFEWFLAPAANTNVAQK